jgi:hypothetical protein
MGPSKKVTLALMLLALPLIAPSATSWNSASRMAMIQSIVERHSFVIDESDFIDTGDKVFIDGHFYSEKAPLPAFIGVLAYFPLYHLGIELDTGRTLAQYLIVLLTVKLLWSVALLAFCHSLGFTPLDRPSRRLLVVALGFGSLFLSFSSVFNNHCFAASFLSIGFYFYLRFQARGAADPDALLAGLFLSLAGACDVPTSLFFVAFGALMMRRTRRVRTGVLYCLPLLLTALPTLAFYYAISGSVVPVQLRPEYFDFPGSLFASPERLAGLRVNRGTFLLEYSFDLLLGPRGFLLYNPLLFVAIPGLVRELVSRRPFRAESATIGVASTIIVAYYALMTTDYSGWSYSTRWFIPLLPLWFFFLHGYLEDLGSRRKLFFGTLLAVSGALAAIGLLEPWSDPNLSTIPLISNLKQLL